MSQSLLSDFPLAPGVSITDTGVTPYRTYANEEIDQRINAIAHGLQNLNLPKNSSVAIIANCSYDFVTSNVAIYRARLCVVPVNFKVPLEQVHFCLHDANTQLVLCESQFRHLVPVGMCCIEFGSAEFENMLCYDPFTIPPLNADDVISILYTSGTTGSPKGVVSTYANRMWAITKGHNLLVQKLPPAVAINVAPLYHLAGLNHVELSLFYSLHTNTHIVLMPAFDTKRYISLIPEFSVTTIKLVAPMMSMILQERDLLESIDTTSVDTVVLTSSFAPKKLQDEVKEFFPNVNSIENPYGLTETNGVFGLHPLGIPKPDTSAGYPIDGVKVRLDDNGVLQIRSPAILTRYHNRPELNNTSITEDGYFITGDIFRVNKYGFYFYIGRADDMFKSGGEKIYPSEIESVIDRHTDVLISAVVGVPDEIKGYKPYAFVQLKAGHTATPKEIQDFVIANVASYQIPRQVWILDALPKTNIGKIDRKHLSELAEKMLQSAT